MKKHLNKKRVVLAAIVTVALALASGVAYAYWTSSATGTGTATAGTSGVFTISSVAITPPLGGLVLNSDAVISGTITNNTTSSLQLNSVVVDSSAGGLAVVPAHPPLLCDSSTNFTVSTLAITGGSGVLAPGAQKAFTGTLHMNDLTSNQDGCKDAGLTLNVKAS